MNNSFISLSVFNPTLNAIVEIYKGNLNVYDLYKYYQRQISLSASINNYKNTEPICDNLQEINDAISQQKYYNYNFRP
jgi:hypothetical protein